MDFLKNIKNYNELPMRLITSSSYEKSFSVSYGIICFSKKTDNILLVKRRYSVEFLDLLTGNYRHAMIGSLMVNITQNEANLLKELLSDKLLFRKKYLEYFSSQNIEKVDFAEIKFIENSEIINNYLKIIKFDLNTEWIFPKGKINKKEFPIDCAKREFMEESGLDLSKCKHEFLSMNYICDTQIASNDKKYLVKYWIVLIDNDIELKSPVEDFEIIERKWMNFNDSYLALRKGKRNLLIQSFSSYKENNFDKINNESDSE